MNYIESGMDFLPLFENYKSMYMEKSIFYKGFGEGVRSVEFITLRSGKALFFIEAKSSSPKPTAENNEKLDVFLNQIIEKFLHSFYLFLSVKLNINKDNDGEFLSEFHDISFSDMKIVFLLIINGHDKKWLPPILDGLHRKLIAQKKIWKIELAVWNDDIAIRNNFITSEKF